ncbi:MAG: HTTM domain-containing protein [Bacteroidota bacterium]
MKELLFRPIDIASLVFFRIAFGALAFADVLASYIGYHLLQDSYNVDGFRFKYYAFEWVEPFPEPFMTIFFILMLGLALCILVGFRYQLSASLFAVGFTYIFLQEKAHYLNHAYLFCWLCFVMIFLPAHRAFSVDVWRKPALYRREIPFWSMAILPGLMAIVYFYGGIAKINPDWLQAMPLKRWLAAKSHYFLIGPILEQEFTAYFMAYGGLLLDSLVVFFLLNKRTRIWAFAAVLFFHVVNHLVFAIGIFPFLSVAITALYFPPNFPRVLVEKLSQRFGILRKYTQKWETRLANATPAPLWQAAPAYRTRIMAGLAVVLAIHLLLPWRHLLYPGNVAWTEEGHRYSWRMMLRSKSGSGYIEVQLPDGTKEPYKTLQLLNKRQRRKMKTHPDMILQLAHHIRDEYRANGEEVAVFARYRVRLNGKPKQFLVDPSVDLAKETWHMFEASSWIIPLAEE